MGNTFAQSLATVPALRGLVEKYGPPSGWPEVLARMEAEEQARASTTPRPTSCASCSGTGLVNKPYPNPHATLSNYRAAPCPECGGAREQFTQQLWAISGIPDFQRERCTFASWDAAANPMMWAAVTAAKRWAAGEGTPFLVLRSRTKGVGKTHLAVAAAAVCIAERDERVGYFVVPNFLDALRRTQRQDAERSLEEIRYPAERWPAVILDDLGANRGTAFAEEQLFQVINSRYSRGLRTLITTNVPLEELEDRTRSRLGDSRLSLVVPCEGADFRLMRHEEDDRG